MVAQHVRFLWDVGGGAGEVQHPLKLEPGKSAEERNWYNIQIDRLVMWQWYIKFHMFQATFQNPNSSHVC